MLSPEIAYLVQQEQHKDHLRHLKRQQILQLVNQQPEMALRMYRKAVGWLGDQMVKWGSKLQHYNTQPSSAKMIVKIHH